MQVQANNSKKKSSKKGFKGEHDEVKTEVRPISNGYIVREYYQDSQYNTHSRETYHKDNPLKK